jgi:hypothetical protein
VIAQNRKTVFKLVMEAFGQNSRFAIGRSR